MDFVHLFFNTTYILYVLVVGFVLTITGVVFTFGFNPPQEPPFKKLNAVISNSKSKTKKKKEKKQANGYVSEDKSGKHDAVKNSKAVKGAVKQGKQRVNEEQGIPKTKNQQDIKGQDLSKTRDQVSAKDCLEQEDDGWKQAVSRKDKKSRRMVEESGTENHNKKTVKGTKRANNETDAVKSKQQKQQQTDAKPGNNLKERKDTDYGSGADNKSAKENKLKEDVSRQERRMSDSRTGKEKNEIHAIENQKNEKRAKEKFKQQQQVANGKNGNAIGKGKNKVVFRDNSIENKNDCGGNVLQKSSKKAVPKNNVKSGGNSNNIIKANESMYPGTVTDIDSESPPAKKDKERSSEESTHSEEKAADSWQEPKAARKKKKPMKA